MKKLSCFLSLACAAMFAACSSNDDIIEETQPVKGQVVTIGVGLPGSDATRVTMDALTSMKWAENDVLQCWGYANPGWPVARNGYNPFNITSAAGTTTAKFSGTLRDDCKEFVFKYVGAKVSEYNLSFNKFNFQYTNQNQVAINDFSHIKDHIVLTSPKLQDVTGSITMAPENSILKLTILNMPEELRNADSPEISWYLNYADGAEPVAVVKLNGKLAANGCIYMAFDPENELFAKNDIAFVVNAAGKVYKATATSKNGKVYEAGKIYTVSIDNDSSKGSLAWEKPQAVKSVFFENAFASDDDVALWTSDDNIAAQFLDGYGMWLSPNVQNTFGYVVSENVKLCANANEVTFEHACAGFSSSKKINDYGSLLIRNADVSVSTWTPVAINVYPDGTAFKNSGNLEIPAEFNDCNVQFAFRLKTDDRNRSWYIKNFQVKGN